MDLGKIIVVADNGMNTQENKYLIVDKGNGYIVSKSVKKSWTKIRPWALDNNDYTEIKNSSGESSAIFFHEVKLPQEATLPLMQILLQ